MTPARPTQPKEDAMPHPLTAQHTPWTVVRTHIDGKLVAIAIQDSKGGLHFNWDSAADPTPQDEAHYTLLASAPALLTALRETLSYFESLQTDPCETECEAMNRAHAAIAAAEGGKPE